MSKNPFLCQTPSEFTSQEEDNIIEISCDNSLKIKLASSDLVEFRIIITSNFLLSKQNSSCQLLRSFNKENFQHIIRSSKTI